MKKRYRKEDIIQQKLKILLGEGYEACLSCMLEKFWKTEIGGNYRENPIYEKKQRRVLRSLSYLFRHLDASTISCLKENPRVEKRDKCFLYAIDKCEDHRGRRKYKLISNPADYEVVDGLRLGEIEAKINLREQIINQAVRQFPEVFKKRLKFIKIDLPFLEEGEKNG